MGRRATARLSVRGFGPDDIKTRFYPLVLALLASEAVLAIDGRTDACDDFFDALEAVPHQVLSRKDGVYTSLWDGKQYPGCEVSFVTDDRRLTGHTAPVLDAAEGTELHALGWRVNNSLGADGAGQGIFGIERGSVLCLISNSQPAYLDEASGQIIQSRQLEIVVQCREREG